MKQDEPAPRQEMFPAVTGCFRGFAAVLRFLVSYTGTVDEAAQAGLDRCQLRFLETDFP
jgi:hypothetical protein